MTEFANIVLGGAFAGCVLALLATGYTLVYSTTGILNFAQGAFIVLGALLTYSLNSSAGIPVWAAVILSALIVTVIACLIYAILIGPALPRLSSANLLLMMGGILIGSQGAAFVGWGPFPVAMAPFSKSPALHLKGLDVATQGLWIAGLAVVSLVGLALFLSRTTAGKALRATASVAYSARLVGIPVERMRLLAFCASGTLGALAGAFDLPYNSVASSSVINYSTLGLVAVTLGGLGSVYGAIAGGLVLGISQALVTGYVSNLYGGVLTMALLIAVLTFRPQGLLVRARGFRMDARLADLGRIPAIPHLPRYYGRVLVALALVAFVVVPHLSGMSGNMRTANIVGVMALAVIGLDLLSGTAGQINLGQAAFMAAGGYTSAILMVHGTTPLLAILAGMVGAVVVGAVFALLVRRLSGIYLGVVTLAFGLLAEQLATGLKITGGSAGLVGIPSVSIFGFSFDSDMRFYYLTWGLVFVVVLILILLNASTFGRLLRSLHGDPVATAVAGFNVGRGKLVAILLSSACAAVSGALYASYFHYLAPSMVGFDTSLMLITAVVIGGASTVVGPVVGVALLTVLPTLSQSLTEWFGVIEGGLLVLTLRFLPSGLYGGLVSVTRLFNSVVTRAGARRPIGDAGPAGETALPKAVRTAPGTPSPSSEEAS
jgi:branched-chain amino acid transport system permease protein